MKNLLISLLTMSLIIQIAKAEAQNCAIANPLVIDAGNFNQKYITQKINEVNVSFDEKEIAGISKLVKECNLQLNSQISEQKIKRDELYKDKQELLKVQDFLKLKELLKAKQESLGKIEEQIRDEVETVSFKGLYIIIIKNINPITESKSTLTDKAITALRPVAVEDIKSGYIASMSEIGHFSGITEYLESESRGEMTLDASPLTNINPKDKVFITLLMVSVAPLQKPLKPGNISLPENDSGMVIFDLMTYPDYLESLIQQGIADEMIQALEYEIETGLLRDIVVQENMNAVKRDKNIRERGLNNRLQLEKEIADLQKQISNHNHLLKAIIETKTPVKYDEATVEACIKTAQQYFDMQIKNVEDEIFELKAMELIFEPNIQVTYENLPAEEIAKKTVDKYNQLEKKYERLERFMEKININDAQISGFESGQSIDIYRKIDKIWLFPVPGENDNFMLHLVAKFTITDKPDSGTIEEAVQSVQTYTHVRNGVSIEFVSIPGGRFTMGSPFSEEARLLDETQHQVTLSAFNMSKYEVTFEQYDAFCEATGRRKPVDEGWGRGKRPVINVSWDDANTFAQWIGCRLPTEAEWEYACRAGTSTPFNIGNCLSSNDANYNGEDSNGLCFTGQYISMTTQVGSYPPNDWGLCDMHANVSEWCADWYEAYPAGPITNPKGSSSDSLYRVYRGGSWDDGAEFCRSSGRGFLSPSISFDDLGFRLVLLP